MEAVPENFDGAWDISPEGGQEWSKETLSVSPEKQREKASKALAGIKRTQKDERKTKTYSDMLIQVLKKLVQSEKNDQVIDQILQLLHINTPAVFILAWASIGNEIAREALFEYFQREKRILPPVERVEKIPFSDTILIPEEREMMNEWMELLFLSLTHDASIIATKRILNALDAKQERSIYKQFLAAFFSWFLLDRNLLITEKEASSYSDFILSQLQKRLLLEKLEEI